MHVDLGLVERTMKVIFGQADQMSNSRPKDIAVQGLSTGNQVVKKIKSRLLVSTLSPYYSLPPENILFLEQYGKTVSK